MSLLRKYFPSKFIIYNIEGYVWPFLKIQMIHPFLDTMSGKFKKKMFLLAFYIFFPFWTSQYIKEIDENIRNVDQLKSSNTMTI